MSSTRSNSPSPEKAVTQIQRLWRGHQIRKNMALSFPSVLTHRMKLEIWRTTAKSSQEIESKLFAVHATDFFPEGGIIRVVDPKARGGNYFRPTTHFALGGLVRSQGDGKISREQKKFAIITPLKDLTQQLLSLNFYDTYILGDFKLTQNSILLTSEVEAKQLQSRRHHHLKFYSYDSHKMSLRDAISQVIKQQGGYDIATIENDEKHSPWAPATFQSESINLNTPQFFGQILKHDPHPVFGAHYTSLFGSVYFFGIIDNALTQLGFSRDYYGNIYHEDCHFSKILIEFGLQKIEKHPMAHPNRKGSDVLELHLLRAREGLRKLEFSIEVKSFNGDYSKARISRLIRWPELHSLMEEKKNIGIHNPSVFLCLYALNRILVIGEDAGAEEGLVSVFIENILLLKNSLFTRVMNAILWISSVMKDWNSYPRVISYFHELLIRYGKINHLVVDPLDKWEAMSNKIWMGLQAKPQDSWHPTYIDLADATGNVPLTQAIIARDEPKALELLHAGADIQQINGIVPSWDRKAPLLKVALRYGMVQFAKELLGQDDFIEWDQVDAWGNTPLCEAVALRQEDIATILIQKGAGLDACPHYGETGEKDLMLFANKMGLGNLANQIQESLNDTLMIDSFFSSYLKPSRYLFTHHWNRMTAVCASMKKLKVKTDRIRLIDNQLDLLEGKKIHRSPFDEKIIEPRWTTEIKKDATKNFQKSGAYQQLCLLRKALNPHQTRDQKSSLVTEEKETGFRRG